jgi:hypothetical protein
MTFPANSRRNFLKTITTTALVAPASLSVLSGIIESKKGKEISDLQGADPEGNTGHPVLDGASSPLFEPISFRGNMELNSISQADVSKSMAESVRSAPSGNSVCWGIPFNIRAEIVYLRSKPFSVDVNPLQARWIIFMHTSDQHILKTTPDGFYEKPFRGVGGLGDEAARYTVIFEDGMETSISIRQRIQIGMFQQIWGENSIESVAFHKPVPVSLRTPRENWEWGSAQTRVNTEDRANWINWLWAWENPDPGKKITGLRFEPSGKYPVVISAITAGNVKTHPLRWNSRQKAVLTLPDKAVLDPLQEEEGILSNVQLDLGQVISLVPALIYPQSEWAETYNNKVPLKSENKYIVEYTAHPEALFHIKGLEPVRVSSIGHDKGILKTVEPADQVVKIKVTEKGGGEPVPVKFHAHGEHGEYLAPIDRHRQPNRSWFQDYSTDFVNGNFHNCTYIPGETVIKLPVGRVYLEISKGFEIEPIRKTVEITGETENITIEINKMLHWRERGWVSADTHVHFLSPETAMLEGSGEGVNIVNLLASQWGELMTNAGDFDGKTTHGSRMSGSDGEYLVRVGTENRQHIMGHISLLGYEGNIILPMTTGGPDESALGDPIEILLTEWAMQCKKQNGIVILPHFPNPRLENAASIISGGVDGVEMTSWSDLYSGINPYSLTDWYRYLNCGYFVAAVGGTDKMSAGTAVGTVRTYVKIPEDREFTYEEWKESVRQGNTFVTYGPLVEFSVEGKPAGTRIDMPASGGTVNISWEVASVTIPMSRVDLIVNGEVKESVAVPDWKGKGNWRIKLTKSSWVALLVRGHYPDKPEIIAAHTSPVMIKLKGLPMIVEADGLTILEQVEGAMAYLDTIGTRADTNTFKRMMMVLTSAHRTIHNRMHEMGYFHQHTSVNDHSEHH